MLKALVNPFIRWCRTADSKEEHLTRHRREHNSLLEKSLVSSSQPHQFKVDAMVNPPHIKLYTDSTPNGIKVSMALEELGIPYDFEHIDISTGRQKEPWYLEINPNGRIPAIVDTYDDGQQIRIFEGGSILQYLTDRYDPDHKLSFPKGSREYWECNNWLFFQHGGKYYQRHLNNAMISLSLSANEGVFSEASCS